MTALCNDHVLKVYLLLEDLKRLYSQDENDQQVMVDSLTEAVDIFVSLVSENNALKSKNKDLKERIITLNSVFGGSVR